MVINMKGKGNFMEKLGLNQLREMYLKFFESKGHLRLPSYSLVPQGDKSLLLINSGMAPMKKYFTGEITPPKNRVTTCQKCIRTPDIERVGITARHGTYFEMLGNFSFGDYFKNEAIEWAWEFFTEVLNMPKELLYCSVYEEDEEAREIWINKIGVEPSHVVKMGKEDNFWEHGAGPCGPCSEIYFDRGEKYGCGEPNCAVGCECDRYVEVWNLVFTQFENDGNNNYTPLAKPNIDTGMGLERLACVMQDVDNLFLVDTVQNIMKHVSEISGVQYGSGEKNDISLRVISDHIRSTTFMIGDGVMPSNEGRGYVLRRLLRRAARHGKLLGIDKMFLSDVCDTVINENKDAYPELSEKAETIKKIISYEEESFYKTIDQGLSLLNKFIENASSNVFSGDDAFKLNDTYGFPLDLTKEILSEKGMQVDEERFKSLLLKQREMGRSARKNAGADAWKADNNALEGIEPTEFVGYEDLKVKANILAVLKDNERVNTAGADEEVVIILDKTPFYAEGGGQIGDKGIIEGDGFSADVTDTIKNPTGIFIHKAIVVTGELKSDCEVTAGVDIIRRKSIMRNHTAAHLLQAALKKVLGEHVEQAGQMVDENRVRFDFTHFSALTNVELAAVEMMVNQAILQAVEVDCREMSIEEAKKIGATALFGEKYGETVRVVAAGEFSKEFCGGTHMDNTSKLGLFKVISEASAAAGIRRIEAVTGLGVFQMLSNNIGLINEVAANLKVGKIADLPTKAMQLNTELREKDRLIEQLNSKIATTNLKGIFDNSTDIDGVKVIATMLVGVDSKGLKTVSDRMKDNAGDNAVVGVLAGTSDDKGSIVCMCSKAAIDRGLKAGAIVKAVAMITGGNGGGKPDFAMAGVKDLTKIDEAISAVSSIVEEALK